MKFSYWQVYTKHTGSLFVNYNTLILLNREIAFRLRSRLHMFLSFRSNVIGVLQQLLTIYAFQKHRDNRRSKETSRAFEELHIRFRVTSPMGKLHSQGEPVCKHSPSFLLLLFFINALFISEAFVLSVLGVDRGKWNFTLLLHGRLQAFHLKLVNYYHTCAPPKHRSKKWGYVLLFLNLYDRLAHNTWRKFSFSIPLYLNGSFLAGAEPVVLSAEP